MYLLGPIAPKVTLLTAYSFMAYLFMGTHELAILLLVCYYCPLSNTVQAKMLSISASSCLDRSLGENRRKSKGRQSVSWVRHQATAGLLTSLYFRLITSLLFAFVICLPRVTLHASSKASSCSQADNRNGLPTTHSTPIALATLHSYTFTIATSWAVNLHFNH